MSIVPDELYHRGGVPVDTPLPQGNVYFVDNAHVQADDGNAGTNRNEPKLTIQSAIDAAPANSGSIVYVMGSGVTYEYYAANVINATGSALYGVYRENIHLDATDHGLQLIGINRPFITGNDGTSENDGSTPTIQIGNWGVSSAGPKYCRISGFHIGGWGDDADDAGDANRKGVGIAIGDYYDTTYNDDCYSHLIDNCYFRATNCEAGGNYTNTEDVHTWIKGFGNEKIEVKNCLFFAGQVAVGMMPSQNNQAMLWLVKDCEMHYQGTASIAASGTPLWNVVRNCTINPASSGKELLLTAGGTGSMIVDCSFPLCASALDNAAGLISTAAELGTFTGWAIMNGKAQLGYIFDKD